MKATVLWFTGLSGSGKTTIASGLYEELTRRGGKIKILDGDEIRNSIHSDLSFTPDDIEKNNQLIAELCKNNINSYNFLLVPIISPFRRSRRAAKDLIGSGFVEIYIKATIKKVISRDVKGLYKKAIEGKIENFIGIDKKVPYEEPFNPDITINTELEDPRESISKIIKYLNLRG